MNLKKIITFYYIVEIGALLLGYVLLKSKVAAAANYMGMAISIACAVGFGLAFYVIYLLLKKRITSKEFFIPFLLALFGVVIPYLFLNIIA